jgi:poly(beta-D-mannuronate) lyase
MRASQGEFTLRHGNRCTVDGNYFLGNGGSGKPTGGIRVIGEDHVITNNYFEKTSGIAGGVIVLTCGIPDSPLKGYWQIKKGLVAHNTFIDNAATCIVLNAGYKQRGRTLLPENVTIANNIMLASDSPKAKSLVTGEEGTNFKWMGNLVQGAEIGAASAASGMKVTDLKLKRGEDGLFRPTPGSPAIGAAQGDVPVKTDIDGQKRPSQKRDVGCDQLSGEGPVINKPFDFK